MKQVLYIHWWTLAKNNDELYETMKNWEINPFEEKKRWRKTLEKDLSNYQVIKPEMPNKEMACYKIRKLRFEKHFPYLTGEEIILVWHSLWAMFLLKYLSENKFPKRINQLHFVSAAIDDQWLPEWDNYLWDFECKIENIKTIQDQCDKIWIWHSKDDPVVPFNHSERLAKELPNANYMIFEDRQHFSQEHFPELIETIKSN